MPDTYTIYQRGRGKLMSFESDDPDEALDEAIEAIGFPSPEIDCVASWLTLVTCVVDGETLEFQIVEDPHGEQPWG